MSLTFEIMILLLKFQVSNKQAPNNAHITEQYNKP